MIRITKLKMNNKELKAETEAQQSETAELFPSAPLAANRLIAEFMDVKIVNTYHSDWNMLMPVFKKFRKLTGMKMPDWLVHTNNIENWIVRVNIQESHSCLVAAIKWYNQQGVSEGI